MIASHHPLPLLPRPPSRRRCCCSLGLAGPTLPSLSPSLSPSPLGGARPSAATGHPLLPLAMTLSEGCLVIPDLVLMEGPVAIGGCCVSYWARCECVTDWTVGKGSTNSLVLMPGRREGGRGMLRTSFWMMDDFEAGKCGY